VSEIAARCVTRNAKSSKVEMNAQSFQLPTELGLKGESGRPLELTQKGVD
jgi:hypothetical protein